METVNLCKGMAFQIFYGCVTLFAVDLGISSGDYEPLQVFLNFYSIFLEMKEEVQHNSFQQKLLMRN